MDGRTTLEQHTFSGRQRRTLALIALLYLLLALSYMLATPPLESSDEYKHYPFVQYVQTQGKLPVLRVEDPGRWLQEAAQPPLYYLLMALLTAPIDTSDLPEVHQVNKYAFVGDPNQVGNKNLILHRPEQEIFPWDGTVLAVYVIRLASIGLGLGTVLLAGRLGLLVAGDRVGLLAAALTAFNPMFLFVNAAVNNDSLAILLGTAGLYWLVRLWREDPHPAGQPRPFLFLGLLLGLGLLTKLSLGGLLGLALLALVWRAWRRRDGRYLLYGGLWVALPALLLPLPWFWRNLQLYGDPTGLAVFIAVQDKRDGLPTLADWLGEFGSFYRSYWGLFGGVNVAAPQIVYWLLNGLALVGAAGLVWWLWRQRSRLPTTVTAGGLWLLAAWVLTMVALLLRWNLYAASFQGRLLFPALPAANILWAIGLLALVRPAGRSWAPLAMASLLALIAALLPWITIRPAYAFPEPIPAVPSEAHFGPISFYDQGTEVLRLVGVAVQPGQRVWPGDEPVALTLYWQATADTASQQKDYLTAVTLLGRNYEAAGQVNRHPAGGMVPARDWQPGQIWQDVYHIYPAAEAAAPSLLRIRASVYDPAAAQDLEAHDPQGNVLDLLLVGEAVLEATGRPPTPPTPQEAVFQQGITFRGYELTPQPVRPGETLKVTLYWQASETPAQDYTLFLHLLDPAGNQLAGADGPPLNGDYPTRLWQAGDWIVDSRPVVVPAEILPGEYTLAIGFYDPQTGERLPLASGDEGVIVLPVIVFTVDE